MRKLLTILSAFVLAFSVAPAQAADNTWITNPQLTAISLTGSNVKAISGGYLLSTQVTHFDVNYTAPAGNAGKFAQLSFFDFTGPIGLTFAANANGTSSVGCDPQVLSSDIHACYFRLDGYGKAKIRATLTNVNAQGAFKFKILAGPNIQQSGISQVLFVAPTNKVTAVASTSKALLGGAGLVQFKVTQNGKPTKGIRVAVSFKGVGAYLSTAIATSDSKGLVTVYLSNQKKARGSSVVTVKVDGGTATAKSTITWVSGSLGK
jgi:hypothetical protein